MRERTAKIYKIMRARAALGNIKVVSMPLFIRTGIKKPKNQYFNLNNYRNWHHMVSNNLKVAYKEIMKPKVEGWKFECIALTFFLHRGDKRAVDRANILSIHEKFFCDGLVEYKCVNDDKDKFVEYQRYFTGDIDKENPRVDIYIDEVGGRTHI